MLLPLLLTIADTSSCRSRFQLTFLQGWLKLKGALWSRRFTSAGTDTAGKQASKCLNSQSTQCNAKGSVCRGSRRALCPGISYQQAPAAHARAVAMLCIQQAHAAAASDVKQKGAVVQVSYVCRHAQQGLRDVQTFKEYAGSYGGLTVCRKHVFCKLLTTTAGDNLLQPDRLLLPAARVLLLCVPYSNLAECKHGLGFSKLQGMRGVR
jgi:hypothetical protein